MQATFCVIVRRWCVVMGYICKSTALKETSFQSKEIHDDGWVTCDQEDGDVAHRKSRKSIQAG